MDRRKFRCVWRFRFSAVVFFCRALRAEGCGAGLPATIFHRASRAAPWGRVFSGDLGPREMPILGFFKSSAMGVPSFSRQICFWIASAPEGKARIFKRRNGRPIFLLRPLGLGHALPGLPPPRPPRNLSLWRAARNVFLHQPVKNWLFCFYLRYDILCWEVGFRKRNCACAILRVSWGGAAPCVAPPGR